MKEIDEERKKALLAEVEKEFPGDPALQQIYFARKLINI